MSKLGVLFAAIAAGLLLQGCAALTPGDSSSAQVLGDVRSAETIFLAAETVINVKAAESGKPVSKDVRDAEDLIISYLTAAKAAAQAGDKVTAEQKLDLFNQALIEFNAKYAGQVPTTLP